MNLRTIRKRGLALLLAGVMTVGLAPAALATDGTPLESGLLTEPFLQVPGGDLSERGLVHRRGPGPTTNQVLLYENGQDQDPTRAIDAETTQLSQVRGGKTTEDYNDPTVQRIIWRHEAVVTGLPEYHGADEEKVPYQVVSDGAQSEIYTLQAQAQEGDSHEDPADLRHPDQEHAQTNYEKLYEAIGPVDAVLANGGHHRRARPGLRLVRRRQFLLPGAPGYLRPGDRRRGIQRRPLLQNAPSMPPSATTRSWAATATPPLNTQFNDPTTRAYAEDLYDRVNSDDDPTNDVSEADKAQFIQDNSFNTTTWEEVLTLPESDTGDERYYAVTIGDLRVIVLEVARIWRGNSVGSTSKYSEIPGASVDQYGFGQHIFEPIGEGSDQLAFLEEELQSDAFQNAKYKMVMFHWQFHSRGQPDPRLHRSGGLLRHRPRHRGRR